MAQATHEMRQLGSRQQPVDELDLPRAMVAEFLACFFLMFVCLGGVYSSAVVTFDVVTVDRMLFMALCYGLGFSAILYTLSYPSADRRIVPNIRHANPAITFAMIFAFRISPFRALMYLISQITGTGVGVLVFYYCTPFTKKTVSSTYLRVEGVAGAQEGLMEFVTSYILYVILFVTLFGNNQKQPSVAAQVEEESPQTHHELHCLLAGCAVFACALAGAGVSGGYMNPLFSLGIGIMSGNYRVSALLVPFASSFLAVATGYLFGFQSTPKKNRANA